MRALRFDTFGDPSVLHVADLPDPTTQEAIVRVEAASVNPSDMKNVAGLMDWTVLPRIPGRDFAGVVVSGPPEWEGAEVWGTGGDVGFTRDGSHAELIEVPIEALARKPEALSFDEAATVGVNFVTAWAGAVETARLVKGETIAIFGVSGGVGGAVAQIAHALGATVIGVSRRKPEPDTPAAKVIDEFVALDTDVAAEIRRLTKGSGVGVVYDAVGGVTTNAALASLARRGRLVVISAAGSPKVDIDIRALYRNETRILGVDSGKLSVVDSAHILQKMLPHFESGDFRPLPITARYSLDDSAAAYQAVASQVSGRVVINP
ncbi:quinone oxidoreductase family protein [Mycobacterium montefiorense]|uniref:Oxidoreductase n=1 Tax=Mycobacterium montefiorense TaxID=154654 RepID=A0AA37PIE3_9MYCO|nr:zinc-binding alcohol dehydrogenase family protein [Mycobacterium montefiorense]GBG37330.1 oxidoreductase [Mycobacterium montefiorense]GKU35830.1 oxidoreductase [Mycobacterium montefiorense]GKU39795.1 oxidoreductase [Mycobacterium montefiorense]GKU47669.1 oxidoreductase [Mycobacterium montefiorense]GKU48865.1 oxidoreductase [Mycobacterium montefiorense]